MEEFIIDLATNYCGQTEVINVLLSLLDIDIESANLNS